MNGEAPKVTRARMITEFADGSATYLEARDPELAEWQCEYEPGLISVVAPPLWVPSITGITLRIKGNPPLGQVRIERRSGEIPPELADRAVALIDAGPIALGALAELRPYLARIAGKQP